MDRGMEPSWNAYSLSPLQQFTEGLLSIRGTGTIIASELFESLSQVGIYFQNISIIGWENYVS